MTIPQKSLESMMSTDSSHTRETGQINQSAHDDDFSEQPSSHGRPLEVSSHEPTDSLDPTTSPPSSESKWIGSFSLTAAQKSETPADAINASAEENKANGNGEVRVTTNDSSFPNVESRITSDASANPSVSSPDATSITTTATLSSTTPSTNSSVSKATTPATTTTTFSRRLSVPSFPQPLSPEMGLHHPKIGVNGHAFPRGAGESRDAPRNPSALPTGPCDSTVRHRERLIGPVTACVAPPPLRIADAQRERDRLLSVNQRLMSKPVKRKLWDVDQSKLGPEIEEEYKRVVEEDLKRFNKRWEALPPNASPDTPSFYHSEVITRSKRRNIAPSSTESEDLPSCSSAAVPDNVNITVRRVSDTSKSEPKSEAVNIVAGTLLTPSVHDQMKSKDTKDGSKQPEILKEGSPKKVEEIKGADKDSVNSCKNSDTPATSSTAMFPSTGSLNTSTESSSSFSSNSGASSLETTPTQATSTSPMTTNRTFQKTTTRARRGAPNQEKITPTERPLTRANRQRNSSKRNNLEPYSKKNLRL